MGQQHTIGRVHTTVVTHGGKTTVTYHSTPVVIFDGKTIELNSGGWQTATTKSRMNQTANQFDLGFTVSQRDFSWYVTYKGEELPFYDFITLHR